MSLLYKDKKDITTFVEFKEGDIENSVSINFYNDGGKFGTMESLDSFKLTPERLLQILQEREDITDDEN